ncbi:MAG: hypothetical protein Kow0026_02980 [Oricola sp.]
MRNLLLLVAICALLAVAGLVSAERRSFPYWQTRMALAWLAGKPPDSVTRITDTGGRTAATPPAGARVGVFIAYGQSNAANFGERGYRVRGAVYNFLDGATYVYEDPALGANGTGGSVWGRVGDGLIETGQYDAVIFATTGFASKTIAELADGHYYDYFKRQYAGLAAARGHVDGILFHQGEENHRDYSEADYAADFDRFLARLRADGIDAPVYLSQVSYCANSVDAGLIAVQDRIIRIRDGVVRGPNTDLLTDDRYRRDGCHFSAEGLAAFAAQWVEAIRARSESQALRGQPVYPRH